MSHAEFVGISGVAGVVIDHGHAEFSGITGSMAGAVHGHAEISGVSGTISTPGGSHAEFTRLSGVVEIPSALQARGGVDFQTPPIMDVVLDGSSSTGAWVSATWAVVSDTRTPAAPPFPTAVVPISIPSDTDSVVTVQFPPHPETYTVTLQLTVTDGITISTDTVLVTVWAWSFWRVQGTGLVPKVRYRTMNSATAP